MLISLFEERSTSIASRLLTAIALSAGVFVVVFGTTDFRSDEAVPGIISLVLFGVMLSGFILKQRSPSGAQITAISTLAWSAGLAFIVPSLSPLIVLSTFLAFLCALYMPMRPTIALTLTMILGATLGYVWDGTHSWSAYYILLLHSVSLMAIAVTTAWHQGMLNSSATNSIQENEQAKLERERLQALINSMTDGVIATDIEGRVAVYNGSALDILNINTSLDGRPITDFMKVVDHDGRRVDVLTLAQNRQGYLVSRDYLLELGDFESINLYVSISPVKIGFGSSGAEGYILLLRDITREKSLEEERDEFISVVSHELRTPITIAEGNIGNAELLLSREKVPTGVSESIDAAHKQVVFLSDMINDLSTLSRAERGKLREAPEEIDIHDLVRSLQRDYRGQAQQKNIEFKTFVDKEVDSIFTSRLYVREIIQNFITNAIKYTQEGDVELRVRKKGSRVEFSVRDSGIGISKSDQKHLFKKFFRSEDYRTRENNGTGLGLYVTMKLAKLIGAQIGVKSELNQGSTFIVTVPSMKGRKAETD